MTPTEALQHVLTAIQNYGQNADHQTATDLISHVETLAEQGLADQPGIPGNSFVLEFNGFDSSRRGIDSLLKGAVLGAGGTVRIHESDIQRYRDGYDLLIRGDADFGIVVSAVERA